MAELRSIALHRGGILSLRSVSLASAMKTADLLDLLITRLAKASGKSRGHWRRVLGPMKVYARETHPSCNWSVEPSGSVGDVATAQDLLDGVRAEHPFVAR